MKKPLAYLACPYSHPDKAVREHRYRVATKTAGRLIKKGYTIFSPITHSHPIHEMSKLPTDWEFWKKQDMDYLSCCSRLFVIKIRGWRESVGVQEEIRIAIKSKIPIEYIRGS